MPSKRLQNSTRMHLSVSLECLRSGLCFPPNSPDPSDTPPLALLASAVNVCVDIGAVAV